MREPLTTSDMDDVADAITKVLENAEAIAATVQSENRLFTPVEAAISTDVR